MNPPEIIRFAEFITISFKLKFPNLFDGMTNDDGVYGELKSVLSRI